MSTIEELSEMPRDANKAYISKNQKGNLTLR